MIDLVRHCFLSSLIHCSFRRSGRSDLGYWMPFNSAIGLCNIFIVLLTFTNFSSIIFHFPPFSTLLPNYFVHRLPLAPIHTDRPAVVSRTVEVHVYDQQTELGGTALLRCEYPHELRSYVRVSGWLSDDGLILPPATSTADPFRKLLFNKSIWI